VPVELRVLGCPDLIATDGRSLHTVLAQPKRFGLLAYLAVARPARLQRRDALLALFWPDYPENRARNALNQALSFLRRSVGDALVSRGTEEVGLDREHVICDAVSFWDAAERGESALALSFYRGDLLAALHVEDAPAFGEWLEQERRHLRERAAVAATELAECGAKGRDLAQALAWACRAASLAPHDERCVMQIVSLYDRMEEPARAIAAYDDYTQRLARDLDVQPSRQLHTIAGEIRARSNGRPAPTLTEADAPPFAHAAGESLTPTVAARTLAPPRMAAQLGSARWVVACLGLVMLAVTGMGWWRSSREIDPGRTVRFPLGAAAGQRGTGAEDLAMSPRGDMIAYVGLSTDGLRRVFVRPFGDLAAHALAGTDGASQPFFSPDDSWVGFLSHGQLQKIRVSGGPVTSLAPMPQMQGASWGTPNEIVVSTDQFLVAVPASGGAPKPISALDSSRGEFAQRWPLVLVDGNTILYASCNFKWGHLSPARIAVLSRRTGAVHTLDLAGTSPLGIADGNLVYASLSGALMAVPFDERRGQLRGPAIPVVEQVLVSGYRANAALSRSGSLVYQTSTASAQLVLADRQGMIRTLLAEPRGYRFPRFSPDGNRIAVGVRASPRAVDTWLYDVSSTTFSRLTTDGQMNTYPEWTPDGRRVLFHTIAVESGRGHNSLRWQPADGSGPAEPVLELSAAAVIEGTLAPDGRVLVYRVDDDTRSIGLLWLRRLTGDTTPTRLTVGAWDEWAPRFSPDGRWLAYSSNESGVVQVYLRSVSSLRAHYQVSIDGGGAPVWSHDGRTLFYTNRGRLMAATLAAGPTFRVTGRATLFLADFQEAPLHADYDVSPDGEHVVFAKSFEGDLQTVVVDDWRRELVERMAAASKHQ
jgi:DNA-binding SARP family transcriptional activator/Tol biopolymer transport system component